VKQTASSLTADLLLAGTACNAFGADITHLSLSVNYEDSKLIHNRLDILNTQSFYF
jgi:alpha-glucosidase